MSQLTIYYLWVAALTLALLYPVGQLVWVISVRRMQKKLQKTLNADQIRGQKRRAYFVAVVVCLAFSLLFNYQLLNVN